MPQEEYETEGGPESLPHDAVEAGPVGAGLEPAPATVTPAPTPEKPKRRPRKQVPKDVPKPETFFDCARIEVLEDGRVQASVTAMNDPEDELIAIVSARKAAAFIFGDVTPAALVEAAKVKPLGEKS